MGDADVVTSQLLDGLVETMTVYTVRQHGDISVMLLQHKKEERNIRFLLCSSPERATFIQHIRTVVGPGLKKQNKLNNTHQPVH